MRQKLEKQTEEMTLAAKGMSEAARDMRRAAQRAAWCGEITCVRVPRAPGGPRVDGRSAAFQPLKS